jgi:DNA polymerase theta
MNSKKKSEDEAEWEMQERFKSRCIWLTGQKGLTEHDAAVLIIQEAKELLANDLLQMGVDWKPAGTILYSVFLRHFAQRQTVDCRP